MHGSAHRAHRRDSDHVVARRVCCADWRVVDSCVAGDRHHSRARETAARAQPAVIDQALIEATAARYGLSPTILRAQVLVESNGDPDALRIEEKFYTRYVLDNINAKAAHYRKLAACSY